MIDMFAWLLAFFLFIAILAILLYQLMCLADLEMDYINPYDLAKRINGVILPEFVTEGAVCFLHLISGHWLMFLLCLPYVYYNMKLYSQRQYLIDVTEIFNHLPREKRQRLYKLGYSVLLLFLSILWMIGSILEKD